MSGAPLTRILLRLRELSQLFNSMDPSPFLDRDLDADAEEYIVSWAREAHLSHDFELVIQLATPPAPERVRGTEEAVQHYFASRAEIKDREFSVLMRRGRSSLGVGLFFLATCLLLAQTVGRWVPGPAAAIVREGLNIGGWVAMWRPLEIYLYDWWPLRDERRMLERLARIRVRVVWPNMEPSPVSAYASETVVS
jgi:hypothetical protein